MDLQEDIGKQVKEIREQQGKTQEDVGREIGTGRQYISKIERGASPCSLKRLQEIARVLNSTVTVKIERNGLNERKGINEKMGLN